MKKYVQTLIKVSKWQNDEKVRTNSDKVWKLQSGENVCTNSFKSVKSVKSAKMMKMYVQTLIKVS